MNRILIASVFILVVLILLALRRRVTRREPHCHYIYGCEYNAPDWAYWDFKTPWKI